MVEAEIPEPEPRVARPTEPTPDSSLEQTVTSGPGALPAEGAGLRFVPGTLLGERYRIVAPAGHGGMGEVYRAEDLRLRQPVALKFLPVSHAQDRDRLERLLSEVRLAREVAHPNVCRVYDFVDTGSEQFVAMEYVDGESLAALLQRVSRLPQARTIALAHEIVRGLAAVHERGILHRDLKPENVMVDGRGHARLMDFGVASLSGDTRPEKMLMGTPCYVAPEQFYGGPPSSRTEVYALGVLLYELLTGRLPFRADTIEELARRKSEQEPAAPSTLVADLDPALEALVLRCIDRDPAARPASARAVAEALPGGDVLDVTIAAGETPDREVVAEARDAGAISRAWSWAAFGGAAAALLAFGLLLPATSLLGQLHDVRTPRALAQRCEAVLRQAGWQPPAAGEVASGFGTEWSRYYSIGLTNASAGRWQEALRGHSPLLYYYRHAGPLSPLTDRPSSLVSVLLDHAERLVSLEATPALQPSWSGAAGTPDWTPLFAAAGLDRAAFTEVPPRGTPATDFDRHQAWDGPFPGDPDLRMHVEVASLEGRLASFRVQRASAVETADTGAFQKRMALGQRVEALLLLVPLVPAVALALRHLHRGRVDREGSQRLAAAFFGAGITARVLEGEPLVRLEHGTVTAPALGYVLTVSAFVWLVYMAAEPYVRQHWPRALVGWARLLGGRVSDPVVGRDALLGVLVGAWTCVLLAVIRLPQFGVLMPPLAPFMPSGGALASSGGFLAELLRHAAKAVAFGLTGLVALLVLRSVLRSELLAVSLALLALIVPHVLYGVHQPLTFLVVHFLLFFPATVLLRRAGLFAFVVFYFSYTVLVDLAGSADPSTWTGRQGLAAILLLGLLATLGLYASLGRRLRSQPVTIAG